MHADLKPIAPQIFLASATTASIAGVYISIYAINIDPVNPERGQNKKIILLCIKYEEGMSHTLIFPGEISKILTAKVRNETHAPLVLVKLSNPCTLHSSNSPLKVEKNSTGYLPSYRGCSVPVITGW